MSKEPEQYALIKDQLQAINEEMRIAQASGHDGKRLNEALWPVIRLHAKRTRLVHDALQQGTIDQDTASYCEQKGWLDKGLMGKWKQAGFKNLCCVQCIQRQASGSVCICRVPGKELGGRVIECQLCGCRGCCG